MQILVSGTQPDVGEALRSHVDKRLQSGVTKYFPSTMDAYVVFGKEGQGYRADCSVHVGHVNQAQAKAGAGDIYQAFDQAAERLEKRLRRYKCRLRGHHGNGWLLPDRLSAQNYILAPKADEAPEKFQPVIVAEHTSYIHRRSVGEAVMQLDLAELPVLTFRNGGNGNLNVVYRRPGNHIGWIDLVADSVTDGNADTGN
jgi:ribosomal subunit interface protein